MYIRAHTLKRHLQRVHPSIYQCVVDRQQQATEKKSAEKDVSTRPGQTKMTTFFTSVTDKVTVSMTAKDLKNNVIDMVVNSGVAYSFFESSGFQGVIHDIAKKLDVSMNRQQVRQYVTDKANEERLKLKAEIQQVPIFLKLDCATRLRVNYLALNIRYYCKNENRGVTKTLKVMDTYSQHTSEALKKFVLSALNSFEIPTSNIISIVSDNASNMVKFVKLINDDLTTHNQDDQEIETDSEEEDQSDSDERDTLPAMSGLGISHMRCAAHSAQLAIADGLKGNEVSRLVGKSRRVAKEARTPIISESIKAKSGKAAIIDQDTRWGSTYLMIERVLELKPYIQEIGLLGNRECQMSDFEWRTLQELKDILNKPFVFTKKLQMEDLSGGYFFRKWKGIKLFMASSNCQVKDDILDSMNRREPQVFNRTLIAATYIDVRHMEELDEDQIEEAKSEVCSLVQQINVITSQVPVMQDELPETISVSSGESESDEDIRALKPNSKKRYISGESVDSTKEDNPGKYCNELSPLEGIVS